MRVRLKEALVPAVLAAALFIILLIIEYEYPYFFLQDDNRDYNLPNFIHCFESLLQGELPFYNFHQFLGIPHLALGQPAALYPLTYISVFASSLFFGHYFATVDILVIIHLLIGAVGFYQFARFFALDRKAAFFAGLSWPLSSFIIYASNSWAFVAGVAAYFPWMLLYSFRLYKTGETKAAVSAVAVRLLLFYAGHIQYFILTVIFEFLTVLFYGLYDSAPETRKLNLLRFFKKYIIGYMGVFILALPLLLPMWHQTTISAMRSDSLSFNVFVSQYFPLDQLLKGIFYPFTQVSENTAWPFRNMVNLAHVGYLPILLVLAAIIENLRKRIKAHTINSVRLAVFAWPAVLAYLWSTNWAFNLLIYQIPILNRFRWPFKIIVYFDFYLIILAALVLSQILARLPWREAAKKAGFGLIIGLQIFNFLFLYTGMPYKDFGEHHGDALPLTEPLREELAEGRIVSAGFEIWQDTPQNNRAYLTAPTLGFNYATLWGLDYFAGCEPLLSSANATATLGLNFTAIIGPDKHIPVDHMRKAAVKWYIVPKEKESMYAQTLGSYGMTARYRDEYRTVFFDEKAWPMVFSVNGEAITSLNYRKTANTIETTFENEQATEIVFNFVYNPYFVCYIDGKKTDLTQLNDLHFSVLVPAGNHHLILKYRDLDFIRGTLISGVFIIICLIIYFFRRKCGEKS